MFFEEVSLKNLKKGKSETVLMTSRIVRESQSVTCGGHGRDSKEEQQNLILLPTYVPYSFLTEMWGREMVSLQFTVEGSHTGTE